MANLNNRQKIRVQTFSGGQNSADEPTVVNVPFVSVAENVLLDKQGNAQQRLGLARQGDNPDSLVAHYTFDASDSTDDKGSLDGTDTVVTYVDGKFGKCASFDGATSKITVDADTTIDVVDIGTFTLSAWVYVTSDGENDVGRIIDKWSGTKVGYRLWVHSEATSKVKVSCEVGHATTNALSVTDATVITLDSWTKVEATYDGTDILIYINGALATTTDTSGVGAIGDDGAVDLTIGNETAAVAKTFDGQIDDVRIYNAVLTAAELDQSKMYGLHRFQVTGTIDQVFRMRSDSLESLDSDLKGWTVIDSGFTTDKDTWMVRGRASDGTYKLYVGNATENVHSVASDGTTVVDEGNTNTDPPRNVMMEWHDNRLFCVDSNGDINYSDILDGQTFNRSTNIFRSKSPTQAIKSFKEKELVIYNADSIEVLSTSGATPLTDWSKTLLSESIEFDSPRSVVNVENDQIFLARDGVRLLSRTTFDKIQAGIVSQPIQDIIDDINQDAIDKAAAWFINNRYYLAIPTGTATENNKLVIYDVLAAKLTGELPSGWTVIPAANWTPAMFTDFEFGDNEESLVVGDNRALSLVYQHTGNHDNGETITAKISGVDHTIDGESDAIWDPVQVVVQAGVSTTVTVQTELDRGGAVDLQPATISLTGGAPVLPIALPFALGGSARVRQALHAKHVGRGVTCRVHLTHDTYNKRPTFVEYLLYGRKLNPRSFL